ncbi:hypothetical protein ACXX82_18045 [Glaciimonas sp. GNP009]
MAINYACGSVLCSSGSHEKAWWIDAGSGCVVGPGELLGIFGLVMMASPWQRAGQHRILLRL